MDSSSFTVVLAAVGSDVNADGQLARLRRGAQRAAELGWGRCEIHRPSGPVALDMRLRAGEADILIVNPGGPWWPTTSASRSSTSEPPGRPPDPPSTVPVIAYLDSGDIPARQIRALLRWEVRELLIAGQDDHPETVAHMLARNAGLGAALEGIEMLRDVIPRWFIDLLQRALLGAQVARDGQNGVRVLDGSALADLWMPGGSLRGFRRMLEREGLPPPGWIARWLLAVRAAALHRTAGRELWRVAMDLGLPSAKVLSRRMKRLTGRPGGELEVEELVALFRARCRQGHGPI